MIIPDEVKRLARAGIDQKLYAIKALRAATGIGLALAKDIVETLAAGGEVQLAPALGSDEAKDQRIQRPLGALCKDGRTGVLSSAEIATLLEILADDEDLIDFIVVTCSKRDGVLVATQRRLLVITTPVNRLTVEEFLLDQVYLIHHRAGLADDSITVFMGGSNKAVFTNVEKGAARAFVERVSRCTTGRDLFEPVDESEHLEWLEALYASGALSTQEFADRKRRILGESRRRTRRESGPVRWPS